MSPTVVLNVSKRPDIADLARVHALEGVGDVRSTGRRINGAGPGGSSIFLLGVALEAPVRAAFAIAFPLPEAETFLRDAGNTGHLVLATTNVAAVAEERPVWLAIDLDGSAIEKAL